MRNRVTRVRKIVSAGTASVALTVLTAAPASAAVTGKLRVTVPDQSANLNSGGSGTFFSVVPPNGARCEGDSEHGGYFVFSYLVPKGVDPRSVSFAHIVPSRGFGLRTLSHYYGGITTEPNTGRLQQTPPNFLWARLSATQLIPAGQSLAVWEGGLACEYAQTAKVTTVWNFEIAFHSSSSDPRGFAWTILLPATASSSGANWLVWVIFGVIAVGGGTFYSWSRRQKSKSHETVVGRERPRDHAPTRS